MLPGRKYTPEDILAIAWRKKWLILALMTVITSTAVAVSFKLPNRYRSETLILVIPQRVPESYVRSTITMRIEDRLRSISQEILSRTRLEQIIIDFNLYPDEVGTVPMEEIVAKMRANVSVPPVRDDAFKVAFEAESPRVAMIVADRLATMFIEENYRDRAVQADGTNQFLETQLNEARGRLLEHEQKLEAYRRRYSGELPSQLQGNLQVIQATQNQIQTLTDSINRDRDRRLLLEQSMSEASEGPAGVSPGIAGDSSPAMRTIDRLERARNELRELQTRLKPEHPDVIAKVREIGELETKARDTTGPSETGGASAPVSAADLIRRTRVRQYQQEIDKLDHQIANKESEMQRLRQLSSDYQRRVEAVPGHESELTALMRDYETLQKVYSDLLAKKENSNLAANLERQQVGEQFRILDPARLPEEAFSPNRLRIAVIAAGLSLAFALGLIALFEYRDSTLRTEDEIVRTLVLPVIATIPVMAAAADIRRRRRTAWLMGAATMTSLAIMAIVFWQVVR